MNIDTNSLSPLAAALKYAELGWPIFPLHTPGINGACSCGKQDCKSVGKHPRISTGVKGATTDISTVTSWWNQWPNANIGLATGIEASIAVLDVDVKADGDISLAQLEDEYGKLPETLRVHTGSGGEHIVFKYPGESIKNSAGKLRAGVDFRTQGGYIVAAPSLHVSGNKYQWTVFDSDVAELPEWLRTLLIEAGKKSIREVVVSEDMIPDGQRNTTLFALACSLRSKGLAEDAILAAVQVLNNTKCNPPLDEAEVVRIVSSAGEYEAGNLAAQISKTFNQTDVGNCQRLVARYGHIFRYVPVWKKFLVYDGRRFSLDDTGEAERLAKETVRQTYAEAAALTEEAERKKLAKHAMHSESQNRIKAMIALAQTELGVPVTPNDLDADDWLLNCLNGTIDLRKCELREHSTENLITKLVPVEYDAQAECPTWLAFLNKIMDGNQELVEFLQKAVGYSLTGSTQEQCLFILHGAGANGKSTFLNTIEALLADYAEQTPTDTLMAKKNEGIRNDIARLQGARFVTAAEAEQGKTLAESLIKQMTGGDKLTARFLHGEYFSFVPKLKLFLATNHKPNIKGTDNGIWRRIRLIPFNVTIPENERDSELPNKLKAELPGILNWAVNGCQMWLREGLAAPKVVNQATDEYRSELDWLQAFIDDRLIIRPGSRVSAAVLYQEYQSWAHENGEHEYSQRILGMRLKDKGFKTKRSGASGTTEWIGIGAQPSFGFNDNTGVTEELNQTEADFAILQ